MTEQQATRIFFKEMGKRIQKNLEIQETFNVINCLDTKIEEQLERNEKALEKARNIIDQI